MSPAVARMLTPHGLMAAPYEAESLADAVRYEPHDGVYTVTNTFNRFQVLKWTAHLDRLEDSAQRAGIALHLDRRALGAALHDMISSTDWPEVRFRVTVPQDTPDTLILTIEPFQPQPEAVYTQGVRCITLPDSARVNAAAKTTGWMHDREQHALPPGIYTGLLLDADGHILEGVSSNFYAVLAGALWTAGSGVLPGIAQQMVLEVAPEILPVERRPIHVSDVERISEAFISSSSRGIVPVVKIDGIGIGAGQPGDYTLRLRAAYAARMRDLLERL
jgi:branched-chain amino acid aminotransferase